MKPAIFVLALLLAACGAEESPPEIPTAQPEPSLSAAEKQKVAKKVAELVVASLTAEPESSPTWRPTAETTFPLQLEEECEVSGHVRFDGTAVADFQSSGTKSTMQVMFDAGIFHESCAVKADDDSVLTLRKNPGLKQTGSQVTTSWSSNEVTGTTISTTLDLSINGKLLAQLDDDGEQFDCDVALQLTAAGVGDGFFTFDGVIEGDVCGEEVSEEISYP